MYNSILFCSLPGQVMLERVHIYSMYMYTQIYALKKACVLLKISKKVLYMGIMELEVYWGKYLFFLIQ